MDLGWGGQNTFLRGAGPLLSAPSLAPAQQLTFQFRGAGMLAVSNTAEFFATISITCHVSPVCLVSRRCILTKTITVKSRDAINLRRKTRSGRAEAQSLSRCITLTIQHVAGRLSIRRGDSAERSFTVNLSHRANHPEHDALSPNR